MDATFQAAVQSAFNPASDPATQQQANQWLNTFATTPEAWDAALAVLDGNVPTSMSFFAANMLLNKARMDWGKLQPERKTELQAAVSLKLQQLLQTEGDGMVAQRLSLVLAGMAVRSGPQPAIQLAGDALALTNQAQQSKSLVALKCGLGMLCELCVEGGSLDTSRATALQAALQQHVAPQLLNLMQSILVTPDQQQGAQAGALEALRCLHAWSQDITCMTSACLDAARLYTQAPVLYTSLFSHLTSQNAAVSDAAATLLACLLGVAPEDTINYQGASWHSAYLTAVDQLAALQPYMSTPGEAGLTLSRNVARCISALSDACVEFTAGALLSPGTGTGDAAAHSTAVKLAEIMVTCVQRPERTGCESVLDYLININTIPVAKRAPALQSDIYASTLPLLLKQAQYPGEFTGWEECEEDEDAFTRLRDHHLLEVLETSYALLGPSYLMMVQQALEGASSWQEYEVCLYALRAVNMPAKLCMLGKDSRADAGLEPRSAEGLGRAAQASAILLSATTSLCTPAPGSPAHRFLTGNPWVVKEACRLVGEYAAWFAKAHLVAQAVAAAAPEAGQLNQALALNTPLLPALHLTLTALGDESTSRHGAQAFRNLCVRCSAALTATEVLTGLVSAALQVIAPSADSSLAALRSQGGVRRKVRPDGNTTSQVDPDHEMVVEGLGRLLGTLPVEAMAPAWISLTQPLLQRCQAFAQAGTSTEPRALQLLAQDLSLLASTIRFMEFPGDAPAGLPHPTLQVLEAAWPTLSAVAQHEGCRRNAAVVTSLFDVYQRSISSCRSAGRDLLPPLMTSVSAILSTSPHPGCFEVLGKCVEMYGELKSVPALYDMQTQALVAAVATVTSLIQASPAGVTPRLDLVRALYSMSDLYYVFARETLLTSPALPQLVSLASSVVTVREREPVAMALAFLSHVLGVVDKLEADQAAARAQLESCMAAHGAQLIRSVLMAVADSCPRQLARPLAGLLYVMLYNSVWGLAASAWLTATLQAPDFTGVVGNRIDAQDMARIHAVFARNPPLSRGRFDGFVSDLSSVLRGEAEMDTLLAWEM